MKPLATILALLVPSFSFAFTDIETSPYQSSINYMRDTGVINGYSDNTFRPKQLVNRAEMLKTIIANKFSVIDLERCPTKDLPFWDIDKKAWYAPYLCVAYTRGIAEGYPDGSFKPSQTVSLVEMSKIVSVALNYTVNNMGGDWYEPYMKQFEDRGLILETIDVLESPIRRDELAEIMTRAKKRVISLPSKTMVQLTPEPVTDSNSINALVETIEESETIVPDFVSSEDPLEDILDQALKSLPSVVENTDDKE